MVESVKETLVAALRYLLKPLVRLAIRNSVTFEEFSGALKKAFVDVASRQMVLSRMNVTEEGISLMATIPVPEVHAILQSGDDAGFAHATRQVSPISTVLGGWHTDQRFTGPYGVLRDIPFSRTESSRDYDPTITDRGIGGRHGINERSAPSFTELVQLYAPGIVPRALLDELLRIGAVADVGNGFYRAQMRSYVPITMSSRDLLYLARVVHNLCETMEFNYSQRVAGAKGLIERSIFTVHGIPKDKLEAFDKFIRERGQVFSDDIDNWYTTHDVEGVENAVQIGVSFYHYIVNDDDEKALASELPKNLTN
jgi:hypothetical protein